MMMSRREWWWSLLITQLRSKKPVSKQQTPEKGIEKTNFHTSKEIALRPRGEMTGYSPPD